MASSIHDFHVQFNPEMDLKPVTEDEIELVWSVFQDLIRFANTYSSKDD